MKKHVPTIREVAQACGVGPMTVSRVLSNTPGKVSAETRERVLQVVREMGYRPNTTALPAADVATKVLGIFNYSGFYVPGHYHALLMAILERMHHSDHGLLIFGGDAWHSDPHRSIRMHYDGACDGVLYPTMSVPDPFVIAMRERGLPFTLIGTRGEKGDSGVDVDNVLGARAITEYLIGLGHRRIAYLGVSEYVDATKERERGYREALTNAGLAAHSEPLEFTGDYSGDWVARYLQQSAAERPTALFCWNDELAVSIHANLEEAGVRVPEEISLVGFDDTPEAALRNLTTYRQPYDAMGRWAVDLTLERIAGQPPRSLSLPGELVVRGSTIPPR